MDIWAIDKLALFLIFFLPGFLSIKVYDLLIPGEQRDFSKSFLEAVAYGVLNFAVFSLLILLIHSNHFYDRHRLPYFLCLSLILLVAPILWPVILLKVFSWGPIARRIIHPIYKPWDYVFGKRQPSWIIVHLKDGGKIGGRFGLRSFASSTFAKEQLYLEETWELDDEGRFVQPVEGSKGIIVMGDQIVAVEFFR